MFLISHKPSDPGSEAAWKKAMAENRVEDPARFAEFMLAKTSRTFALNIQVLPAGLRHQVLLAYLFCRMADTLEDDADLQPEAKVRLLEDFRGLFPPGRDWESRIAAFLAAVPGEWAVSERWDRLLVAHGAWIFPQLQNFSDPVIKAVSACVQEMCDGMIRFTGKHAKTAGGGQVLIETLDDLDRYCYYVAGTVGDLLCDLFALHSPLIGKRRARDLRALSVSFGLGLQLTNILKDIHDDRMRNVSYIPLSLLAQEHLSEQAFLAPAGRAGAARIMAQLLRKAQGHLEDALAYSCLLPRMEPRLRLFCLWPLFMAAETVVLIANHPEGVREEAKMKISRKQVKRIVRRTSMACWSNHWLHAMFRKTMAGLETGLAKAVAENTAGAGADAISGTDTASGTDAFTSGVAGARA